MMAVGLKLDLVRFWSSGLVEMSMFSWDFEVDSWLRFWRWNLSKLCVRTHDMTLRSYFGKMNSTLGSVVPLAMVSFVFHLFSSLTWSPVGVAASIIKTMYSPLPCREKFTIWWEGNFEDESEFWITPWDGTFLQPEIQICIFSAYLLIRVCHWKVFQSYFNRIEKRCKILQLQHQSQNVLFSKSAFPII